MYDYLTFIASKNKGETGKIKSAAAYITVSIGLEETVYFP